MVLCKFSLQYCTNNLILYKLLALFSALYLLLSIAPYDDNAVIVV
jgi:hypothetical protein